MEHYPTKLRKISSEDDILSAKKCWLLRLDFESSETRDRWFPKICDRKLHPQAFGDNHPIWWTPIFFKSGWKSGNKPSPGKMMLISHLPWSFLLAKAVALSVQERIEGWIVDFFILCWLVPGARVFPEISWGYLQSWWFKMFFLLYPNCICWRRKKIPTGPTYRSLRWFVDRHLAVRRFVDVDKKSRDLHILSGGMEGKFDLTKDRLKKKKEFQKYPLHFFGWSRFLDFCHLPACCIKKTPEWPNGVVIARMTDTQSFFMGKFDGMRCYTLESLEIQHGFNKNDGLEEVTLIRSGWFGY